MELIIGTIIAIIILVFGVLSLQKPNLVGADFYWCKYKWFYIPKFKKATNKYYEHQIKVIGVGLIMSAVLLLGFMLIYVIYQPIRLLIQ